MSTQKQQPTASMTSSRARRASGGVRAAGAAGRATVSAADGRDAGLRARLVSGSSALPAGWRRPKHQPKVAPTSRGSARGIMNISDRPPSQPSVSLPSRPPSGIRPNAAKGRPQKTQSTRRRIPAACPRSQRPPTKPPMASAPSKTRRGNSPAMAPVSPLAQGIVNQWRLGSERARRCQRCCRPPRAFWPSCRAVRKHAARVTPGTADPDPAAPECRDFLHPGQCSGAVAAVQNWPLH
jgi:hypothetical protein